METTIGFASGTATRSLTFISVTDNLGTAPAAVKAKMSGPRRPRANVTSTEVCCGFPSTEPMPLLDRFRTRPGWQHKDVAGVATSSEGTEPNRYVVIAPAASGGVSA